MPDQAISVTVALGNIHAQIQLDNMGYSPDLVNDIGVQVRDLLASAIQVAREYDFVMDYDYEDYYEEDDDDRSV